MKDIKDEDPVFPACPSRLEGDGCPANSCFKHAPLKIA